MNFAHACVNAHIIPSKSSIKFHFLYASFSSATSSTQIGSPCDTFAEYHALVYATIHEIDVTALNIPDYKFNPLGSRDIGKIGITGAAAAISNAVYNATDKRVRYLPITLDKIVRT
jgi:hypothetical protein